MFHLRDEAFAIVQDRLLPLRVRMHRLLDFGVQAQKTLFGNMSPAERDTTDETDTRAALFGMMTEMEPYDETWPDYVQLLEDNGLQANLDDMDGGYENLLVYLVPPFCTRCDRRPHRGARGLLRCECVVHLPDEHKAPA